MCIDAKTKKWSPVLKTICLYFSLEKLYREHKRRKKIKKVYSKCHWTLIHCETVAFWYFTFICFLAFSQELSTVIGQRSIVTTTTTSSEERNITIIRSGQTFASSPIDIEEVCPFLIFCCLLKCKLLLYENLGLNAADILILKSNYLIFKHIKRTVLWVIWFRL